MMILKRSSRSSFLFVLFSVFLLLTRCSSASVDSSSVGIVTEPESELNSEELSEPMSMAKSKFEPTTAEEDESESEPESIMSEDESEPESIMTEDVSEPESMSEEEGNKNDNDVATNTTTKSTALISDSLAAKGKLIGKETRIVGGQTATKTYRFFVQGSGCGGSLIAKDVVLTAAHCEGAFKSSALVGAYRYQSETNGAVRVGTRREIPHPNYRSKDNDIMVVQLSRRVEGAKRIKLNNNLNYPSDAADLKVIGLGVTSEDGGTSNILREVTVDYVSNKKCKQKYPRNWISSETMVCAQRLGKDSCYGDSGGPLFRKGRQVGVVSWGLGCARAAYPGVYTNVAWNWKWLQKQICTLSQRPPKRCKKLFNGNNRNNRRRQPPPPPPSSEPESGHRNSGLRGSSASKNACEDTDMEFDVRTERGPLTDKDCAWLSSNRYKSLDNEDLCDYNHIAYRCPSTCNVCNVDFSQEE